MSRPTITVWLHDGSQITVSPPDDATSICTWWPSRRHGAVDLFDVDGRLVAHLPRVSRWRFNP